MKAQRIDELRSIQPYDGLDGKVFHTENQTLVFWQMKKGTLLPEHHHVHEQIAIVQKGALELTVGGETQVLTEGMMLLIPSSVPHSAKALDHCELLDVFHPVREDMK